MAAGTSDVGCRARVYRSSVSTRAQLSFASLVEGHCWNCGGQLERILDWAECIPCGRRFTIKGRHVTEQIAVPPEIIGKSACIGGDVLKRDGSYLRPRGDGMYEITDECQWVVCEWTLT